MRTAFTQLQGSKIREVANAGMGRPDVLAFWFGESDEATPELIRQAAADSLAKGETFYSHNMGLPELREAIAAYTTRLHPGVQGTGVHAERVAVTSGGVNALMLAAQALIDTSDDVLAITPVWPNLTGQPLVMGARLRCHALTPKGGAWHLDVDALLQGITAQTKLLIVNAPNNPTGWTLTRQEQQRILQHCRQTGTWILADEVYERLYYAPIANSYPPSANGYSAPANGSSASTNACAPSFLDIASEDDRLVVVHSFSKSFLMTGWRLGWMVMPPNMAEHMGKLIEFNTSCAPVFVQRAALAALAHEAEITPRVVAHMKACRDTLLPLLQALPGVQVQAPLGGMYAFFKLHAHGDSLRTAKRLVSEAGLGLAPGAAFGTEAEGWLRWCFASKDLARLEQGVGRLRAWMSAQA
jgi:aspartate/methionine/tyrosine aminotransferase